MEYLCDRGRHLVCRTFSIPNLHAMAENLGIKRCWFHSGKLPHYDIPLRRVVDVVERSDVKIVPSREILATIRGA